MPDYTFACIVRPEYRTAFKNIRYFSPETPGLVIANHRFKDSKGAKDYACELLNVKTYNIRKYAVVNIYRKTSATKEIKVGVMKINATKPQPTYRYLSESGSIWKDWVEYKPTKHRM